MQILGFDAMQARIKTRVMETPMLYGRCRDLEARLRAAMAFQCGSFPLHRVEMKQVADALAFYAEHQTKAMRDITPPQSP